MDAQGFRYPAGFDELWTATKNAVSMIRNGAKLYGQTARRPIEAQENTGGSVTFALGTDGTKKDDETADGMFFFLLYKDHTSCG